MNILHVTPYYAPAYPFGGVVRAVEGMARALVKRGHAVTVLTTDALSRVERIERERDTILDGVRVIRAANASMLLRARYNLSTPLAMRQVAPEWVRWADVIHVHEFRTAENMIITPLAARLGKPLILSPHGTLTLAAGETTLKRGWDRLISPSMAKRFTAVIGLTPVETDEARALWKTFGGTADFETIPNGVDADEFESLTGGDVFRQQYGLGAAPFLLYLGRLHIRKGIGVLVEAFKQANVQGARLVIAGPDEGMLSAISPQLNNSITVTGYLDADTRKAALAAADVFVLPALAGEGLPMAALEALAAGVPVILSHGCGLPEVESAGAGLVVPPEVDALEKAIHEMMNDATRRDAMRENARRLIRERYTWDQIAVRLESVYHAGRT